MESSSFWDNPEESQKVMKELKSLKDSIQTFNALKTRYEDIETLIEMGYEENDESLIFEIEEAVKIFQKSYDDLRIATLLSGEYDRNDAILTLHAGAGGTESCDWVDMLYRMYQRWCEKKGFSTRVLDYLPGEEAGQSLLPWKYVEKMPMDI